MQSSRKEIESLIDKYLEGRCTPTEKKLLEKFLQSYQKDDEGWVEAKHGERQLIQDNLYKKIQKRIARNGNQYPNSFLKRKRGYLKFAAILILGIFCVSSIYVFRNQLFFKGSLDKNDVILTLDNGEVKTIREDGNTQVKDANGNVVGQYIGKHLIYSSDSEVEKLVYNTLTVPYGKLFDLRLSDGTHVFLNAGTTLKYPVKFIKGMERNIFLDGEAYFEVAKDKEHPFIVTVDDKINVRALGTTFNISSYEEDRAINTVLLEGSVGIYKKEEPFNLKEAAILSPNDKASWDKKQREIDVEEVETDIYTAWMDRKLIFKHTPFKIIRKKLERYYNVTIQNKNAVLEESTFNASFTNETIEQVLQTLSSGSNIIYKIKNKKIVIE
ncbi:FecR family protein [Snuella lapsa]|uniref:FecR family protein n=1 Tax=Snuella lapsa TaxID=870481 RepID=A0ABP6WQA8_9FLAO